MNDKETKICPHCGGEVLAVAKKCKHCGTWLEAVDTKLPQAGIKTGESTRNSNANSVTSSAPVTAEGKGNSNYGIIAIVAIVLLSVVLIVYFSTKDTKLVEPKANTKEYKEDVEAENSVSENVTSDDYNFLDNPSDQQQYFDDIEETLNENLPADIGGDVEIMHFNCNRTDNRLEFTARLTDIELYVDDMEYDSYKGYLFSYFSNVKEVVALLKKTKGELFFLLCNKDGEEIGSIDFKYTDF